LETESIVENRPPQLCKGCPHGDSFNALIDATADYEHPILFSDIGCYTLAVMPPYRAVHSCVDMGASIGMGHGASRGGAYPIVSTIGDSTFGHSGIQPLLGAIHVDADMTVIILDNATTAMTGTQESMTTGEQLMDLLRGMGVQDLHYIEPHRKNHEANVATIKKAIEHRGLSVIVSRRACIYWKAAKPVTPIPVNTGEEN
jgi:indolepyruvate ferredoxin oxidoreductase alpha subunit